MKHLDPARGNAHCVRTNNNKKLSWHRKLASRKHTGQEA